MIQIDEQYRDPRAVPPRHRNGIFQTIDRECAIGNLCEDVALAPPGELAKIAERFNRDVLRVQCGDQQLLIRVERTLRPVMA